MKWRKINNFYMQFGDTNWTITYAENAEFPYGLFFNNADAKGNFKTLPEAIARHLELSEHD